MERLASKPMTPLEIDPRDDLLILFEEALRAVSPAVAVPRQLPLARHGRTVIMAVGKAAGEMMRVALDRTGQAPSRQCLVVTRYGHLSGVDFGGADVEIIEAGHPIPDANSVRAANRVLEIASGLRAGDQLLLLLSGGGSALLARPAEGIALEDKQMLTRALLQSGATVAEINGVRKHLSGIKGGRLAVAAGAAQVTTWIISDVPGDDPSYVSSGPTVPDASHLYCARETLRKYGIAAPDHVLRFLNDPANETPSADAIGLAGSEARVIARARDALAAASMRARAAGYEVHYLGDQLQAEARQLGAGHAALARRLAGSGKRQAIISGGETTVTVRNPNGRGGRNMEYLLSLAIALDGAPGIHAIACDSDGIDGTEDAAGAVVGPDTIARARVMGLDPAAFLDRNDSYLFFQALGDLVLTGPTSTNVNDFRAILVAPADEAIPTA